MNDKKFYDITDKEMIAQIKTRNVKHRRCDLCGCELAFPDIGEYTREGLHTVACTTCSPTKQHYDLLAYIGNFKKNTF